jgi:hypothetical protein
MKLLAQLLAVEIVLAAALFPVAARAQAPAKVRYQALDRMLKQFSREAEARRLIASR